MKLTRKRLRANILIALTLSLYTNSLTASQPELRGIMRANGNWSFNVYNEQLGNSFWISEQRSRGPYQFESYNDTEKVLHVIDRRNGAEYSISLKQADNSLSNFSLSTHPPRQPIPERHFAENKRQSAGNPQILSSRRKVLAALPDTESSPASNSQINTTANTDQDSGKVSQAEGDSAPQGDGSTKSKPPKDYFKPRVNHVQSAIEGYNTPLIMPGQ